jgi:hypothetical protein
MEMSPNGEYLGKYNFKNLKIYKILYIFFKHLSQIIVHQLIVHRFR